MATVTESGSESDRTTELQEQTRTGTQESVSTPGLRTQTETPGGTRNIVKEPAGMQVTIVIDIGGLA